MLGVNELTNWLLTEGAKQETPASLLSNYSLFLRQCGIQVDRSSLGAPILHPIAQSSYAFWDIENGSSQKWFEYTPELLESLKESPIYPIYTSGEPSSIHLNRPEERAIYPVGEDLWKQGYYQYEALPLQFSDGTYKVLTLATRAPSGFGHSEISIVEQSAPALTLVFENLISRNSAKVLMETYVGKRAGLRVLDGEISRGDGSHIDAVIWFSDLRGFTSLAERRTEAEMLKLLNHYFGHLTDAIESHSGEVLKFIGDAILAIFPYDVDPREAVSDAEAAAALALDAEYECKDYTFGIGLHTGTVFYGNIGGGNRLDFTVIGPSVNIASRVAGLCSTFGKPLLATSDFVSASSKNWRWLGDEALRGVTRPIPIHCL